jgi:hypothetical protein
VTQFRFVAIQPSRVGQKKQIGPASFLHDLLVDNQTDASGRVFYGHAFGYAWLLARWPGNPDDRPTVRTLKRHMARLKRLGLLEVRVIGFGGGMVVRLLGSAKWQNELPVPAVQLQLLASPVSPIRRAPVERTVENPVGIERISSVSQYHMGTEVSLNGGQSCPRKEVRSKAEEKYWSRNSQNLALPSAKNNPGGFEERLQLLREQARMLSQKYAG